MTDDRLMELIEAWGADPDGFPEAERAAAKGLLAAHPARFAAALEEARALDLALSGMPEILPSRDLTEALIASAPKPRRAAGKPLFSWRSPWAPASGFAALATGLFMGVMMAPSASAASETEEVETMLEHVLGYDPAAYTEDLGE